jgi:lysophospholipase L1-like esterase
MTLASQRPKILLLGDSLTQTSLDGWGGGLSHRYQRRADILNRGMSGYNTRWYLEYAKKSGIWEELGTVQLVTIWFGANDASLEKENPHHHVP